MPTDATSLPRSGSELFGVHDRPRRRLTRRIVAVIAAVTIVAAIAGGVAVAAGGDEASRYRTATAGLQSVAQSLDEVAVIEPASQAAVSFPVDGTVANVDVAVGDTVEVAAPLASLDVASLQAAVHTAQAELDQAELTLERALNGEDVGNGGLQGSFTGTSLTDDTTIALISTQQSTDDAVRDAQRAVLDAQRQVDDDLRAAGEALASAQEICAALGEDPETPEGEEPAGPTAADLGACQTALTEVLAAQTAVQVSQNELAAASSALDELLIDLAGSGDPSTPAPDTGQTPSPSGNDGAPSADGMASSSPSSADLIAYQQAVDAAEVQVAVAEQAVKQATIRSPIAGTVVAVDLAVGDSVSAGSSTSNVTIVGEGGYEVTATVSVDDLPHLEVGQAATITPDGTTEAIAGEVVSIGVTATSGDGAVTYPVTIGVAGDSASLRNGSVAAVAIVTDEATEALAVPTSAVHADSGQHSVTVLEGSTTRDVDVEIGAVGAAWTEITEGLDAGEVVVLADLDEPLPGTATDTSGSTQGSGFPGGGQLPGGGRFPGGG